VLLESVVRRKRAKKLFRKSIQRDFNDIAPYLPTNLGEVLDIGCGLGCINILINRHYENKRRPHFFLFDKTSLGGSIYYGWSERGAFYNSLQLAENLLEQNGVQKENITLLEISDDGHVNSPEGVDFVISLISWGFHYPVSTYLDWVYSVLRPGGKCILDIRKGTNGENCLQTKFENLEIISERMTWARVIAIKGVKGEASTT